MFPTNYTLTIEVNYGDDINPLINTIPFDTEEKAREILAERAKSAVAVIINMPSNCILTLYKGQDIDTKLSFSSL